MANCKPDDVDRFGRARVADGEMVDIVEMPLTDVVDLIRGKAGSTVRLGWVSNPAEPGNVEIYQIVRARIELV